MTAPLPLLTEAEVHAVIGDEPEERRSFGCLRTDRGMMPMTALDVDARIVGTFAHTRLTQTFENSSGVPVEATYIFPLPDRAAATRFTMRVAGRTVEGELQERGEARRTYDRAISQGKRASIAEEERPGTFSLRVGNLMPGESATIILEMSGPLPVADGEVTYRFPLVVAPRYMPGKRLGGDDVGDGVHSDTDAVPDASRISPPVLLAGCPNPVRLSLRCAIDPAGLPLSSVRSALHAAWADEAQGLLQVNVAAGERLNRDFILRFRLGDGAMRTSARATDTATDFGAVAAAGFGTGTASVGGDAFMLTLLPAMTGQQKRPRDVVFVVDRSGSMEGWKMVAARRAVARMVDSLRSSDRFCVLAFDTVVDACPSLGQKLAAATDRHRFQAVEWLATVDGRGGTEMAQPLATAANLLAAGDLERDRVLVFVTDGQVGNESQLIKVLGSRLKGSRVFALGIDQAVNAGFLNRLAALGGQGEAELVESEDRVDEVLTRCHRRIDTPLVRDLTVHIEGASLVDGTLSPARLPDVVEGVPAVVTGVLKRHPGQQPTLVVSGIDSAGGRFSSRVPVETSGNPALLAAWGRLHLRDLEDQFDGHRGDRATLNRRIIETSLATKVLCRFTAFVAVDHEVANVGGRLHKVTQAVESPAGWGAEKSEGAAVAKRRMSAPAAPPTSASPAPVRASVSMPDLDDDADDMVYGISAEAEEGFADMAPGAPMRSGGAAPLPPPAPPAPRSAPASLGGMVARAKSAVFGGRQSEEKRKQKDDGLADHADKERAPSTLAPGAELRPEPAPAEKAEESPLSPYVDAIAKVVAMLQGATPDVVGATAVLRRLLETMAHAGVSPAARKPLKDAQDALERNDVTLALTTLQGLLPSTRRDGAFWG
jgi:Ca-activated chloride channel family protein